MASKSKCSSYWIQCTFENRIGDPIGKAKALKIKDPDKAWQMINAFVKKQVTKLEQFKQNDFIILSHPSQSNKITIKSKDGYYS